VPAPRNEKLPTQICRRAASTRRGIDQLFDRLAATLDQTLAELSPDEVEKWSKLRSVYDDQGKEYIEVEVMLITLPLPFRRKYGFWARTPQKK
jgi:hypothetical protein